MKKALAFCTAAVAVLTTFVPSESKEPSSWKQVPSEEFVVLNLETEPPPIEDIPETVPIVPDPIKPERKKVPKPPLKSSVTSQNGPRSGAISGRGSKAIAKKYALLKVGATQFSCLLPLWKYESHWNYRSLNHSSGAYGIPQALPGSKMASAGSDWRTNPITQVKWGIHYVNARYGSACGAWGFWQSHHWY